MNRYAAFLRGINISGKNKISMGELKAGFEALGFSKVRTLLNSGNVLFSCGNAAAEASDNGEKAAELKIVIEKMIADKFGLQIPVYVAAADYLQDVVAHAPSWWDTDDKAQYDNLIFILTKDTPEEICKLIGAPTDGLEKIQIYKDVIFWTFDRQKYQKCSWWKKTATSGIAEKLTIRTASTVRKICSLDYNK